MMEFCLSLIFLSRIIPKDSLVRNGFALFRRFIKIFVRQQWMAVVLLPHESTEVIIRGFYLQAYKHGREYFSL